MLKARVESSVLVAMQTRSPDEESFSSDSTDSDSSPLLPNCPTVQVVQVDIAWDAVSANFSECLW